MIHYINNFIIDECLQLLQWTKCYVNVTRVYSAVSLDLIKHDYTATYTNTCECSACLRFN